VFDQGEGPPVVVIPGLQGRWEWATPALRSLARRCRTISYSLCGDIGSRHRLDPRLGFDNYIRQLDAVLDAARLPSAAICGVSFGGFVAVHYAAQRPERVNALVLASAPGPEFQPTAQQARWLSRPWASVPAFVLTSPGRVWPEIRTAIPDWTERARFLTRQTVRCATAPMIPSLMAARMRGARSVDFAADCQRVTAPTLIVSGDDGLDRVVPVQSTRAYATLIPHAEYRVIQGTGHMAVLTRPNTFSDVVAEFVHAHHF
jgi:2-hydroxy-6-oxonona-2,4-dienedioate hydrolase